MKADWRRIAAAAAPGVLLALWASITAGIVWATLDPAQREALGALLEGRAMLAVMTGLGAAALAAWGVNALFERYVAAPARLLEEAQVVLGTDAQRELAARGSVANRGLARAIDALVQQRAELRRDIERKVAEASRGIDEERSRLAALMSELTHSVVVCNLDGRILLYNARARQQFRALSLSPVLADGAELIGLGRSIYVVFERRLVAHALETIEQRMQRGAGNLAAQFVTSTPSGRLLRVHMAPVHHTGPAAPGLAGFVLMLDDITRDFEEESLRDRLLLGLTEGSRASLANMQAACEMLDFPDVAPAMRERFLGVIREEVLAMSGRVQSLAEATGEGLKTRWPLEDMLGADLVTAASRRIEALYRRPVSAAEVDAALWLRVESFSLVQALACLAGRLVDELQVRSMQLRLGRAGARAQLDLVWSGQAISTETVMSWQMDPMTIGEERSPLSVRDVVERHGGEFWFERERVRQLAFFRFLLPLAAAPDAADAAGPAERPQAYDFDLFQTSEQSRELDERRLADLSFTVFDTETTGLDPAAGDEIIQIGAVRIVNGKLLRQECFEQLVDPQRGLPEASTAIHGIRPEMLRGQPTVAEVLPAFHAFARDSVLVAHNAAFDMRFLQLKEAQTGVRFEQPVLDTLLLSAVVHPQQDSHALEAIAERLGVRVDGRHTAQGDALMTAEIFLRLLPLLQAQGIHTLRQAREAAQRSYYARLKY